ncbi:MAG: hypothetical protein ACO3K7_05225 [Candidatus Marinamargulisbacteria bacterium]
MSIQPFIKDLSFFTDYCEIVKKYDDIILADAPRMEHCLSINGKRNNSNDSIYQNIFNALEKYMSEDEKNHVSPTYQESDISEISTTNSNGNIKENITDLFIQQLSQMKNITENSLYLLVVRTLCQDATACFLTKISCFMPDDDEKYYAMIKGSITTTQDSPQKSYTIDIKNNNIIIKKTYHFMVVKTDDLEDCVAQGSITFETVISTEEKAVISTNASLNKLEQEPTIAPVQNTSFFRRAWDTLRSWICPSPPFTPTCSDPSFQKDAFTRKIHQDLEKLNISA